MAGPAFNVDYLLKDQENSVDDEEVHLLLIRECYDRGVVVLLFFF